MAKRQTKRKVLIRYLGRDPTEPLALLEAIEEAFRPKDIEISVEATESDPVPTSPDEHVETQARETAADTLDQRDAESRQSKAKNHNTDSNVSAKRRALSAWLLGRVSAGWRLFVKVLPTL